MMRHGFRDPYPCHKMLFATHFLRHEQAALAIAWSLVFDWVNADMLSALRAHLSKIGSIPLSQIFQAWADQIESTPPQMISDSEGEILDNDVTPLPSSSSEDSSERESRVRFGRVAAAVARRVGRHMWDFNR